MITFDLIQDKVEFFEATDLATLEKKLTTKLNITKRLCLKYIMFPIKCNCSKTGNVFIVRWCILKQKNRALRTALYFF